MKGAIEKEEPRLTRERRQMDGISDIKETHVDSMRKTEITIELFYSYNCKL